jgi:hypothetical protein
MLSDDVGYPVRLTRPAARLARDRLAVVNGVLEFLRLPQLDAEDLPPVRYRKQADSLTERCVDLVRSAMSSRG